MHRNEVEGNGNKTKHRKPDMHGNEMKLFQKEEIK
jgi:hypothetical protein